MKLILTLFLLVVIGLLMPSAYSQTTDTPVTISSVSSRPVGNQTVVEISADGPLNRAQTFQDNEGFHVVVPDAGLSDLVKSEPGIEARRKGTSIELVLHVNAKTPVGVVNEGKYLTLTVEGQLSPPESPAQDSGSTSVSSGFTASAQSEPSTPNPEPSRAPAGPAPYRGRLEGTSSQTGDDSFLSSMVSIPVLVAIFGVAILGFLITKRSRSKQAVTEVSSRLEPGDEQRGKDSSRTTESNGASTNGQRERKQTPRQAVSAPPSLYGAYRIDQEVGKLVVGQTHRMDVLSSRATEDRRAIEASLIKAVTSTASTDEERNRARGALEEYGFVARLCASVLLAPDAFERSSAARSLGEVGVEASLPFLLEALYDSEAIVRNQVVTSIGELKVPFAIGALLDMARKHPDVPSHLVSRALSACSVEGLDFHDGMPSASVLSGNQRVAGLDIEQLLPASSVVDLPETSDAVELAQAFEDSTSEDVDVRSTAVKSLGEYSVQSAVNKLMSIAREDAEASIRSQAVANLAAINHESVFPAILIALADESREVRAAAARSLSRLNFDRSEAYVRVIEKCDEQTLQDVAKACVDAGIVSQNIDRLATGDHRQAYETFSLICVLAKAKQTGPLLHAISRHENVNVRRSIVHLLATTGEEGVSEQLRELTDADDMPEEVKGALLEAVYKLEHSRSKDGEVDALPEELDPNSDFLAVDRPES